VRFSATVEPAGNATGVEVPAAVVNALGSGRRPEVVITIGGHTWRSRVASMGGRFSVGISAANRTASGIAEGDVVEAGLRLDAEPRVVAEPRTCGPSRTPRAPDAAAAHRQADHHDRRRPRCLALRHRVRRPSACCRPPRAGSTAEPASGFEDADFQDLNGAAHRWNLGRDRGTQGLGRELQRPARRSLGHTHRAHHGQDRPGPRETPAGVRRCHTLAGRW
jgi:Domain of unknown function (DUF1905)